jgi:hypothetical protein
MAVSKSSWFSPKCTAGVVTVSPGAMTRMAGIAAGMAAKRSATLPALGLCSVQKLSRQLPDQARCPVR